MAFIGNTNTTQAFTPAVDFFSGNGSTTAFTLSRPVASVAQVQVTIDNVAQNPSSAYTVSSNTITFTSAPLSGTNNIYVYYTSPITQVIAPGQGTVTATSMASSTGTGAGVFQTSPTITTPTIDTITSAASTALTLKSAGTTAITVDTSQNVGIGTASPGSKLYTQLSSATAYSSGVTGNGLTIYNSSATTGQYVGITLQGEPTTGNGGFATIMGTTTGSGNMDLTFSTRGSATLAERMRINSSGKVLVGTTEADNPTDGIVLYFAAQNSQVIIGHATGTPSGYNYTKFSYNASTIGSITQNGTTAVAYNTSSDYRLKENIAPLTGALDKVSQLKPVSYTWKSAPDETGEGFIAHELAEVCPHAVSGTKDAIDADGNPVYQGIDTSFLVATLTAALQETKALIDTQAETINALTARIEALEGK